MNSNYQWQKHSANERTNGYARQAATQRQLKEAQGGRRPGRAGIGLAGMALFVGLLAAITVVLLSGCTVSEETPAAAVGNDDQVLTLAERIQFQDEHDSVPQEAVAGMDRNSAAEAMSLAERIRFQDRLWTANGGREAAPVTISEPEAMSMSERIRFHDEILAAESTSVQGRDAFSRVDRIQFQDLRDERP